MHATPPRGSDAGPSASALCLCVSAFCLSACLPACLPLSSGVRSVSCLSVGVSRFGRMAQSSSRRRRRQKTSGRRGRRSWSFRDGEMRVGGLDDSVLWMLLVLLVLLPLQCQRRLWFESVKSPFIGGLF